MISRGNNIKELIINDKKKEIFLAINGFLNKKSINEMVDLACEIVNEEPNNFVYTLNIDLRDVIYIDNLEIENKNTQRFLEFNKSKNLLKYEKVYVKLYESQIKLMGYVKSVARVNGWPKLKIIPVPVIGMNSKKEFDKTNYYNFLIDLKNKKILGEIVGSVRIDVGLQYIEDFRELLNGINSNEFELVLDCTKMGVIHRCTYEQFRECCQMYCDANFKSVTLTITEEQRELRKCVIEVGDIVNWQFNYVKMVGE